MRVVADSHVLIFYLFTPIRLSDPALEALGEAEDDAGIVVSAATLGDLWYASHKNGPNSSAPGAFVSSTHCARSGDQLRRRARHRGHDDVLRSRAPHRAGRSVRPCAALRELRRHDLVGVGARGVHRTASRAHRTLRQRASPCHRAGGTAGSGGVSAQASRRPTSSIRTVCSAVVTRRSAASRSASSRVAGRSRMEI